MTKIDGVSAVALVLIVSFAVDRIVTAILFLLSYNAQWNRRFPIPASRLEFCTFRDLADPCMAGHCGVTNEFRRVSVQGRVVKMRWPYRPCNNVM
jgi:hypothetical protein